MAQTGFTPISTYYTTTASAVPTAGNLVNGELALNINTADGKLFYKDSAGVVQVLATRDATSGSFVNLAYTGTFTGGTGVIAIGTNQIYKDASGNVMLGTTTVRELLTVNKNAAFGTTADSFSEIRFYNSTATAGTTRLRADGGNLTFLTSNSEAMRIDSSQNLIVGNTTYTDASKGILVSQNGRLYATAAGDAPANFNRLTNAGDAIVLKQASNSVGSVYVASTGVLYTGTNGVQFTATQTASADANTLDDYEEGTWTPVIATDGTQPTGATYSFQAGRYTKIGRMVQIQFIMNCSNKGTGGNGTLLVGGLPFTSANDGVYATSTGTVCNTTIAVVSPFLQINPSVSYLVAISGNGATATGVLWSNAANNIDIRCTMCYQTT